MEPGNWADFLGWSAEQLEDLRNEAFSYLRQGLYPQAITLFEALVELDPTSAFDHQTLGALYLQVGRLAEALSDLDRALELQPNNLAAQLNRAKALFGLNRTEEGLQVARDLTQCRVRRIHDLAEALVMAYS